MIRRKPGIKIVFTIVSLAVTVGIFYYLLKYVSIGEVVDIIKNVDRGALLMFISLSLAMSIFRAWRYGILLELSGFKPSGPALFLVVLIRNFFSDLLPARIGTLVYVFIVNTRLGIPLGPATSSFSLAFLFDILAVAPMIMLASFWAASTAKIAMLPLFAGGIILGCISLAAIHYLPVCFQWIVRVVSKIQHGNRQLKQTLMDIFSRAGEEIVKTKQAGLYTAIMTLSFLVRIAKYAALYYFLYALLRPLGYEWIELSIPRVFLGISASEIAASLPISGIAAFGAYEGTWAAVFDLLGFPGDIAKLTAISHHLFTQVYGYILGALALVVLALPVWRKKTVLDNFSFSIKSRMGFYFKVIVFSSALIAALYGFSKVGPAHSDNISLKQKSDLPSAVEKKRREKLMAEFPGEILFDSNRSGTFGIYTIRADGSQLTPLIDDSDWHEMFPAPSPDGKRVVFARSKSLNRYAPSEIWVVHRDGSAPRQISENGNFPTFSADGKRIYFERKRKKVMVFDIEAKSEKEIFPAKNLKFKKYQVVKPRVSFNEKIVAFTSDTPKRWNAWYADIEKGEAFRIQQGCEPVPFDHGRKIAFINNANVKERTGIFSLNISLGLTKKIEDADTPRGHEYFPTLVGDDRYLLYSACRPEEHAHETANYQIFVKDLKTERKIRITFDAFTNRWPKLLIQG